MKPIYLLQIMLLSSVYAGAQTQAADPSAHSTNYTVVSAGFGQFYPSDPGHDIAVTFPYTVKDIDNGAVSSHSFSGALIGKFTKPSFMTDLLNVDIMQGHNDYRVAFGLSLETGGDQGYYVKGGYSFVIPLGFLLIKPSVDLFYLNSSDKMGSIDNRRKEIDLYGFAAQDQFTWTTSDQDGGGTSTTEDADHLNVNFRRISFLAEPKLILSTKPMGKLVLSLEAGWMYQLWQRSELQFEQEGVDTGTFNTVGHVALEKNGLLSGFYAAVHVGICFWPKKAAN
jgi:hypothetical protein